MEALPGVGAWARPPHLALQVGYSSQHNYNTARLPHCALILIPIPPSWLLLHSLNYGSCLAPSSQHTQAPASLKHHVTWATLRYSMQRMISDASLPKAPETQACRGSVLLSPIVKFFTTYEKYIYKSPISFFLLAIISNLYHQKLRHLSPIRVTIGMMFPNKSSRPLPCHRAARWVGDCG